jgi:hypothetical protein
MGQLGSGDGTSYPTTLDTAGLEVDSPNAGMTKARAATPNDLYSAVVGIQAALGSTSTIGTKPLFPRLGADPSTVGWGLAEGGMAWYNTAEQKFKGWNGAEIVSIDTGMMQD